MRTRTTSERRRRQTECARAPPLSDAISPPPKGCFAACAIADEAVREVALVFGSDQVNDVSKMVAEQVRLIAASPTAQRVRRSGKRPRRDVLYELCTSETSILGEASAKFDNVHVVRLAKAMDFADKETI